MRIFAPSALPLAGLGLTYWLSAITALGQPAPDTGAGAEAEPAPETTAAPTPQSEPAPVAQVPPVKPPPAVLEVTVEGERAPPEAKSFSREEVRQLPGAFGDPFRAIEVLPGVTPIASGVPFFYVRGAPPGNVGYYLDGIRVPYLFHIGLGPSIVHPGIVRQVDLYPGGYPARFGRYAGGIVAGETTEPRNDLHGEGNLRVFDVGAMVETGFDEGRGTALVGARYSYTAAILSLIAGDVTLDYRDYQARVSYDVTPRDRISVFSFGAYDLLGETRNGVLDILFGSEFYRVDTRYDHFFGHSSRLRYAVTLGWDQTRVAQQRNAISSMVASRVEIVHPVDETITVRTGADVTLDSFGSTELEFDDPDDPEVKKRNALFPKRRDLALGGYLETTMRVAPEVEVTPGVRMDLYTSVGAARVGVDPRIAARFFVTALPPDAPALPPLLVPALPPAGAPALPPAAPLPAEPPAAAAPALLPTPAAPPELLPSSVLPLHAAIRHARANPGNMILFTRLLLATASQTFVSARSGRNLRHGCQHLSRGSLPTCPTLGLAVLA